MESKIIMLPIGQLEGHPDNPRKDVGDVTELADSIRHSGIMQNLTVVPYEGKYRVIIGHRRLAAAKLAGLTELPCLVSDMDYKEQCATMLCENMQRVDLTVPEQAHGVQLLLNLGESVDDIAKKTGFSKATIRKREKIAALPAEKLKEADERGATLEEYIDCTKIDDPEERARLIDAAGTKDFGWKFNVAKRNQDTKKNLPAVKAIVEKFAKPFKNEGESYKACYQRVDRIDVQYYRDGDIDMSSFDPKKKYFYKIYISDVCIYEKVKAGKKKPVKKSKKEIEADKARDELERLNAQMNQMRAVFWDELTVTKENREIVLKWLLLFAVHKDFCYCSGDREPAEEALKKYKKAGYYPEMCEIQEWIDNDKNALIKIFRMMTPSTASTRCYNFGCGETMPTHTKNERLEMLYKALSELGYKISSEEQSLLDGTHEIFGCAKNE